MIIVRVLALALVMCFAGSAAQAQIVWSMAASTCVATDNSIRTDRYKTGVASVQHNGTATGLITLNCPVTFFDTDDATEWQIGISYRDSTGTGATAIVRARLYTMAAAGSAPALLATVHSNSAPNVTTDNVRTSPVFEHMFALGQSTNWIRLDLDRDAAAEIVIAHSVFLRFAPVVP